MSIQSAFAYPTTRNNAGVLDKTFAANGKTQVYFADSLSSLANGVAIDAQGRLLVAAKVFMADGSRFGLARLLGDGSADLAFGNQGSVIGQFEPGFEAMGAKVLVMPDGNILLAGLQYENAHRTLPALALLDQEGRLVRRFGDNGRCVVRLPRARVRQRGRSSRSSAPVSVRHDGRDIMAPNRSNLGEANWPPVPP